MCTYHHVINLLVLFELLHSIANQVNQTAFIVLPHFSAYCIRYMGWGVWCVGGGKVDIFFWWREELMQWMLFAFNENGSCRKRHLSGPLDLLLGLLISSLRSKSSERTIESP